MTAFVKCFHDLVEQRKILFRITSEKRNTPYLKSHCENEFSSSQIVVGALTDVSKHRDGWRNSLGICTA